jgi:hypothetical protein
VSSKILTPHPLSTQRVCPLPAPKAGGGEGTHIRRAVGGWGGVIILEDARQGLASYSIIPLWLAFLQRTLMAGCAGGHGVHCEAAAERQYAEQPAQRLAGGVAHPRHGQHPPPLQAHNSPQHSLSHLFVFYFFVIYCTVFVRGLTLPFLWISVVLIFHVHTGLKEKSREIVFFLKKKHRAFLKTIRRMHKKI